MAAPRPTREEDLAGLFRNLDLHTRVQALEQQNHALEQRVRALEAENQAFRTPERRSTIPESVDLDASDAGHEMVEETLDDALLEQLAAERQAREGPITWAGEPMEDSGQQEVIDESPEQVDEPPRQETSPSPIADAQDADFTVWYENGTLRTNVPAHLLSVSWTSLMTAFSNTRTYLTGFNPQWPSLTHPTNCVRGVVAKQSNPWTVDSPGEFCCKRCFNTQRVCLKYNKKSERLEALPLPEEVRGEEFGLGWFVAEEGNMSNKGVFKGLWK